MQLDATEGLFGLGDQIQALRNDVFTLQFLVLTVGIVTMAHVFRRAGVR